MKTALLIFLLCTVLSASLVAQSLISRTQISSSPGDNYRPRVLMLPTGEFAIVWGWGPTADEQHLTPYGRVVKVDGTPSTPIRKNLITTPLYGYQQFTAGLTGDGRVLVAGTRESDFQLIARPFDSKLRAKGATVATGVSGYSPTILPAAKGAAMGYQSNTAYIVPLRESGKASGAALPLLSSGTTTSFGFAQLAAAPGGYLALGWQIESQNRRAAVVPVPADLSAQGSMTTYETSYWAGSIPPAAGLLGDHGMVLFGHVVNDSQTSGSLRLIAADGRPTGPPKRFPSGVNFSAYYSAVPLSGVDRIAVSWVAGYINAYVQIYSAKGAKLGSPVPVAAADYTHVWGAPADLAWDPTSKTLAVVYSIGVSDPDFHIDVWLDLFRIE